MSYNYYKYHIILFELANIWVRFENYNNKILAEKLDLFGIVNSYNILILTEKKTYFKCV